MTRPSEGIKDLMVTAGIGTFAATSGWFVGISKQPDLPNTCVVAYDSGGQAPNPRWLINKPSVQVRVRGDRGGYNAAYTKCVDVVNALLGLPSQDINSDRWVSIAQIGDINFLGYDALDRPMFSLNFGLIIEPASGTYREDLNLDDIIDWGLITGTASVASEDYYLITATPDEPLEDYGLVA